jgi:hypothetical protein
VLVLAGATTVLFGSDVWTAYLAMLTHLHATVEGGVIQFAGHVDPYGASRLIGLNPATAAAIQIASALVAVTTVAVLWWRRGTPADLRYAALAAGVLMVTPFALFYDLLMTAVSGAWLVRLARRDGFLAGEKAVLVAAFLIDLASYPTARATHLAIGALVSPLLMGLIIRRVGKTFFFEKKKQKTFDTFGCGLTG